MSSDGSPQPSSSSPVPARRRRPRTPPKWVWIVLLLIGVLVAIVRGADVFGDHAFDNIATVILCFVGFVVLAVWFLFLSGYHWLSRVSAAIGFAAVVGLLYYLFPIERVTGELAPIFRFRYSAEPDRLLEVPPAITEGKGANVDLRTTTKDDFPGFLGRHRDEAVDGVKLARNWSDRPPKLVWRQKIGAGWSAFSVVNGHAVTMEQRGEMEMTTCYNIETGRLEWAHSTSGRYERVESGIGPRSTPTIDDGMVFSLGVRGHLACLDGGSGKPIWEKDLLNEYGIPKEEEEAVVLWGRSASPLVVGEKVIVPIGGPKGERPVSLAAYDKRRGTLLWKGGQRQISYCSPSLATLGGVEQILIVNENTASGHDVKTGKTLWEHERPGHTNRNPNVAQAVPISPNLVFLSNGYGLGGMLLRLDRAAEGFKTQVVWENHRVMKTKFSNVALLDGHVYGLSDGILECTEADSGTSKWKQGRYGHGQILRVGDLLLVLTEEGEVVLVEATPERPNHVLGRFQAIEGLTWNNLALYGPYLLVRNAEEAACYKLPLEEGR
jgi:outer membrane protein assembly factor BamB